VTAPRGAWIVRLLRRLVRLLPAEFRADFGAAIEADLDERLAGGDRRGLVRRDLPSIGWSLVREHVDVVRQDLKYALRSMRRTPGFTTMAVLMLALGTGVNTAVFSVIDAVMLQSAFVDGDRLAILRFLDNGQWGAAVPRARVEALAAAPGPFAVIGALDGGSHALTGIPEPRRIDLECLSASMFDVLGTRPMLGRTVGADDDRPGAPAVVVIGHRLWRQLGGTADVLGRILRINDTPVTIVGVMPPKFAGPFASDAEGWLPLGRPVSGGGREGCEPGPFLNVFVRLRDGVSFDAAGRVWPDLSLLPLVEQNYAEIRMPFMVLSAAVACVLLIACVNVGGLQLERGWARRRELALRIALGASRGRLVRHVLTENVLLAVVGAGAGVAATTMTLGAIVSLLPRSLPFVDDVAVNGRVLAFTLGAAAAAGLLAAVLPAGLARRLAPARDLAAARGTNTRETSWTRTVLVAGEVALSVIVLIGAGLMIQTFFALRPSAPGFDPAGKIHTLVTVPAATPDRRARFFDTLLARLDDLPGAPRTAATSYLPLWGSTSRAEIRFGGDPQTVVAGAITAGYLDLMCIPVLAGRAFTTADGPGSTPVVIVNELLARRIRPDAAVIGTAVDVQWPRRTGGPPPERHRIVGVAGDTRFIPSDVRPRSEIYLSSAQHPAAAMHVIVAAGDRDRAERARALAAAVRAIDPAIIVPPVQRMVDVVDARFNRWRLGAWLLGIFAGLAILLAAVGLMTTTGWWVRQRTAEIGVRLALGATPRHMRRLVLGRGLAIVAAGIAAGLASAAALTRFLEGWIQGIEPLDPATFAGGAVLMLAVATAALTVPMRRVSRIDPVRTLRAD
jgi:putative ABC transport system permease protein